MSRFLNKWENIFDEEEHFESIKDVRIYPITMKNYKDWLDAKPALTLRMSALPAALAVLPYISAVFTIEMQSALAGRPLGMLARLAKLICLSQRMDITQAGDIMRFSVDKSNNTKLVSVGIRTPGDKEVQFEPDEINLLRQKIAEINGEKLPDEAENAELVNSIAQKNEISAVRLDADIYDLLDSVALACGIRVRDLKDWTIKEFERRRNTVDRAKRFTVNAIAEGSGASWKNGNPVPSWCYDRSEGMYGSFTPVSDLMGRLGSSEAWLNEQMERAEK